MRNNPPPPPPAQATHGYDVVVLGAGPAGCAAASLLARRAHRVALVRPAEPPAAALAESIPPSARRVLEELGALEAIEAAGLHANRGNSVWWAGEELRREAFAAEAEGFHTDRGSLEEVLARVAASAGVVVLERTTARSAEQSQGRWTVACEGPDGPIELRAPWIVDATGRKGLLARAEREPDRDTTTLAVVRRWCRPAGWVGDEAHHTLVESYADGWAWSVPLSDDVRCLTVMIDQRRTEVAGASLDAILDAELDRTRHVGPLREGAEPAGPAWACPASLYTARRFASDGLILAGDAGSFIDPLSSFGVKKALSSGWLAAVVAHTALVDEPMAAAAIDFFDRREREVYRRYRSISADFFAAAARSHGTEYWLERAEAARRAGSGAEAVVVGGPRSESELGNDPDGLGVVVPEPEVRAAFERLKERSRLRARRGTSVRALQRAAIEGHRIVMQDQLATDAAPQGMRHVRGVDLLRLVDIAPRHEDVPDGWTAYNAVAPPVTLPDYLTALSTAFAVGVLEHADEG